MDGLDGILIDNAQSTPRLANNQKLATIARCVTLNLFCGIFAIVVTFVIDNTIMALMTASFSRYWSLSQSLLLMFFAGSLGLPIGYVFSSLAIGPEGPTVMEKSNIWSIVSLCIWIPAIVVLVTQFWPQQFMLCIGLRDIAIVCAPALFWFLLGQTWGALALKQRVARDDNYE